jgi:CheY-like chemotaxis protein
MHMDNSEILNNRILIIDDDFSNIEVISLILKSKGYEVLVLNDHISLDNIRKAKPNLILLDILLSGEDGRNICKQIKASPDLSPLPVIMLSATLHLDKSAEESGATDFVMKPFDMDNLIDLIKIYI